MVGHTRKTSSSGGAVAVNEPEKYSRTLVYSLYFVGFLEKICGSLVVPLLLRHFRFFGSSTASYGVITSTYGIINMFISPVMGKISDKMDRAVVLLICQAGMLFCYFSMGFASSFIFVVLCRVLSGLFKHSLSLVTAYLADVTPSSVHSRVFGQYESMTSMSVIFGPAIGGTLAMHENGFFKVCMLASFFCTFNFLFILLHVRPQTAKFKESRNNNNYDQNVSPSLADKGPNQNNKETAQTDQPLSIENNDEDLTIIDKSSDVDLQQSHVESNTRMYKLLDRLGIATLYKVCDIMTIQFLLRFAMLVISRNLDIILELQYAASPQLSGFVVSFKGFVGFVSGMVTGHVTKFYSNDARMLYHFAFLLISSVITIICSPSIIFLVISIVPLTLSGSVLRACTTSLTIRRGGRGHIGTMIGVGNSLNSFAKMASPTLGGFAQELCDYGPASISIFLGGTGVFVLMSADLPKKSLDKEKVE